MELKMGFIIVVQNIISYFFLLILEWNLTQTNT